MPAPASIFNYAAEAIHAWRDGLHADAALRDFMHRHPRFPQAGREKLTRAVFAYFRWLRWLSPEDRLPVQLEAAVALQERFQRDPRSVKDQTLAALAVPDWVLAELDFGADEPAATARKHTWLRSLQATPPLWLRARPGQAAALAQQLGHCAPADHPLASDALRYTGSADLYVSAPFNSGAFEIQDLASQLVGSLCAPKPGETWWDVCAGEGGKSLHLADQMANKGTLWCSDRSKRRLDSLKRRFTRAQLFNYRLAPWETPDHLPTKTKFDGILVDAPCSGVGTWARNPDARWTTTARDVEELAAVQLGLLNKVAGSLKPGGRLVYAVCTLTRRETTAIAAAFAAAHPELAAVPVAAPSGLSPLTSSLSPHTSSLTLWPQDLHANGMFIAAWQRK
ncbi:MAG: RsmB/NOP family class I SAM-dependent RNA methyltransferase [Opitutaceae bacterium]